MGAFWHPFADMASVSGNEMLMERADGYRVYDKSGRGYIDATASLWYCNVGYGRSSIVDAAAAQMHLLPSYSTFGDLANAPVLELADRLSSIAPQPDSKVFFTSGGSDSIDTATKLVDRYFAVTGQPDRRALVVRHNAYHGMHIAGTSLAGIPANNAGQSHLLNDVLRVPWDSVDGFVDVVDDYGAERVAAVFCEPIIGAGGVFAPPDGYLKGLREACSDRGILLIADEVVTGFGRVGDWFASTRFGLDPDLVVCAKGITSGYLPLGAVIVSPEVAAPFWEGDAGMWRHGYTYSGHATVAAAALANLDIFEEEQLNSRALDLEAELADSLRPLESHDLISEVRAGTGVLAAVQLKPELIAANPSLPGQVISAARDAGVMTRALATGAIHVSPPLIIDREGLDELQAGLADALSNVAVG